MGLHKFVPNPLDSTFLIKGVTVSNEGGILVRNQHFTGPLHFAVSRTINNWIGRFHKANITTGIGPFEPRHWRHVFSSVGMYHSGEDEFMRRTQHQSCNTWEIYYDTEVHPDYIARWELLLSRGVARALTFEERMLI